jgi:hypothetical protein
MAFDEQSFDEMAFGFDEIVFDQVVDYSQLPKNTICFKIAVKCSFLNQSS